MPIEYRISLHLSRGLTNSQKPVILSLFSQFNSWRHRLVVRTLGFHPENRGSIPLGATTYKTAHMSGFVFVDVLRGIEGRERSRVNAGFGAQRPGAESERGDSPWRYQTKTPRIFYGAFLCSINNIISHSYHTFVSKQPKQYKPQ